MRGIPKIIELLNRALTKELTAINQYFIHGKMCENWGYQALAKKYMDESLGEMKHADELIQRILFLEGTPNMTKYDKINVGANVKKQLESDLVLEEEAVKELKPAIKVCLEELDHASRELLEHILVDEEEHIDWIEGQLHIIKEAGYENYLAMQIHKKD
ncbi:MAG: bacterioferritin [Acidobacteria bacterium]|nr:MAG: bacterioferritin [Acidobacteriota bacterium]